MIDAAADDSCDFCGGEPPLHPTDRDGWCVCARCFANETGHLPIGAVPIQQHGDMS